MWRCREARRLQPTGKMPSIKTTTTAGLHPRHAENQLVDKVGGCKARQGPIKKCTEGWCHMASAAGSEIVRCIAGGSMEHIRWPLVQDQKPRKVASSLDPFKGVSGALPACQGSAGPYNMASGATWEVQGGPCTARLASCRACTARLAGEDIRWRWCKLGPR